MKRRFREKFPRLSNGPRGAWTFFHKAVSCSFVLLFNFYLSDMLFIRQAADTALRTEGFPRPRPKDTAQTCPNDRKDFILLKRNPFESSHAFSEKVSQGDFHHEKFTAAFRFPGAPQENRPRARLFAEAGGCLASLPGWGRYGNSALFSGSLIKRGQKGIYM